MGAVLFFSIACSPSGGGGAEPPAAPSVCRSNGECLEYPRPLDADLVTVAASATDAWATSASELLHWGPDTLAYEAVLDTSGAPIVLEALALGSGDRVFGRAGQRLYARAAESLWTAVPALPLITWLGGQNGDVWVLAVDGRLMTLVDGAWLAVPPPTAGAITSAYASAPDNVWASTSESLHHFDGLSWTSFSGWISAHRLDRAYSASSSELWFFAGGDLHQFTRDEGGTFRDHDSIDNFGVVALAGFGPGAVAAFGYDGQAHLFDGDKWRPFDEAASPRGPTRAVAVSRGEIVTAGASGEMTRIRSPGRARSVLDGGAFLVPGFIAATRGGELDVWSAGEPGLLRRNVDGTWYAAQTGGPTLAANTLRVRVPGEPWAITAEGMAMRLDGETFVEALPGGISAFCTSPSGAVSLVRPFGAASGVDCNQYGCPVTFLDSSDGRPPFLETTGRLSPSAADSRLWCVDDDSVWGRSFRTDERGVRTIGAGELEAGHLTRAVATSPTEVWITGFVSPSVWHRRDGLSERLVLPFGVRDVDASATNAVWFVGDGGGVAHYDGQGLTIVDIGTDEPLADVDVRGPSDVVVVGVRGTIFRWTGSNWSATPAAVPCPIGQPACGQGGWIWDVQMLSDTSGVAVGAADSALLTYDGISWTQGGAVPGLYDLSRVFVEGPQDVWVLERYGDLWHFDGATWTEQLDLRAMVDGPSPGVEPYRSVALSSDGLQVLGHDGGVYRRVGGTWTAEATVASTALSDYGGAIVPLPNGTNLVLARFDGVVGETWRAFVEDAGVTTLLRMPAGLVGVASDGSGGARLLDRNGALWSWSEGEEIASLPSPSFSGVLDTGAIIGTNDVWALAYLPPDQSEFGFRAVHFDGTSWKPVLGAPESARAGQPMLGRSIDADAAGRVWISTDDGRIVRFEPPPAR